MAQPLFMDAPAELRCNFVSGSSHFGYFSPSVGINRVTCKSLALRTEDPRAGVVSEVGENDVRLSRDPTMWWDNRCAIFMSSCFSQPEVSTAHGTVPGFVAALKECGKMRDLERGKKMHRDAVLANLHSDSYLASALIAMYSKCGKMALAQEVFDRTTYRCVFCWSNLILGYVANGESLMAMDIFTKMDCKPDFVIFTAVLKACASLASGKESDKQFFLQKGIAIHKQAKEQRFDSHITVASTLVDMYSKCGSMDRAREVFDTMSFRNSVTWNSLMLGYVQNGESRVAMDLFAVMDRKPDSVTFVAALKACASLSQSESEKNCWLEKGICIHKQAAERGFDTSIVVATSLVDMYSKCGCMNLAKEAFDRSSFKDVVMWNTLILGYVNNGESSIALDVFRAMDCKPGCLTYVAVLKACGGLASDQKSDKKFCLEKGTAIHKQIRSRGFSSNLMVANSLIEMYGKCGCTERAREVFDNLVLKDVVIWSTLILAYVDNGESELAMDLFTTMDCKANCDITYAAALKACADLGSGRSPDRETWLEKGIAIHEQAKETGLDSNRFVANALVSMYSKCGSMFHAREVFDGMADKDDFAWRSILLGHVKTGNSSKAMDLMTTMNCNPTYFTLIAALKVCSGLATEDEQAKQFCLEKGVAIHKQAKDLGFLPNRNVECSLVDMYAKCGSMHQAREVFDAMVDKNVVTWTCLIQGYVEQGESLVAMDLFARMDCEPDIYAFTAMLKACGEFAAHGAS